MNQPDLPMGPAPVGRGPEDRYGTARTHSRIRMRVAVAAGVAALCAWLIWAALAAAVPDVRSQILDFRVVDDHRAEATIEVLASPRSHVDCTLEAQDRDHVVTGVARVSSPPSRDRRRVVQAAIETRQRAVAVVVAGCRIRDR